MEERGGLYGGTVEGELGGRVGRVSDRQKEIVLLVGGKKRLFE